MMPDHRAHDPLLIARFASGDSLADESSTAAELVAACPDCAQLAEDLRLLAVRTASLPAARRDRDFRLSPADAERLRGSWLERALRPLASSRWAFVQPLAGAALAIGVTLAVIGALPLGVASSGGTPVGSDQQAAAVAPSAIPGAAAPEVAAPSAADFAQGDKAPSASTPESDNLAPRESDAAGNDAGLAPTAAAVPGAGEATSDTRQSAPAGTREPVLIGGFALAFLALLTLVLFWLARRHAADPLLR